MIHLPLYRYECLIDFIVDMAKLDIKQVSYTASVLFEPDGRQSYIIKPLQ